MVLLFVMKWAKNKWSNPAEGDTTVKKVLKKTLWFVGTGEFLTCCLDLDKE